MGKLLLRKTVDKSLLKAGLTIPAKLANSFLQELELSLERGEKATINIILNGVAYSAIFTHVNIKVKDREIFQIRYSEGSALSKQLRNEFGSVVVKNAEKYIEIWSMNGRTLEFRCKKGSAGLDTKGKKDSRMNAGKESKKLRQHELHELFIEDLGSVISRVEDPVKKPLILELGSPYLCKIKVYMFNCTCPPGGRKPDEYKSQLILDGQQRNERGHLDDTDGTFILLVGYATPYADKQSGVYVLWDAEEHRTFAYSANLQTKLDPILETAYEDVVLQTKKSGEVVVLSNRNHLASALQKRLQLYAEKLLGE